MATQEQQNKSQQPITQDTFKFDEELVKQKFNNIEDEVNKKQGKAGFNPFLFLKEYNIMELQKQYSKGDRSVQLFNAIKALPDVIKPCLPTNIQEIDKAIDKIK